MDAEGWPCSANWAPRWRAAGQGAVVGRRWRHCPGGIESNLSEARSSGRLQRARAYAAAIGNLDSTRSVDTANVADLPDPRGALKALAARAQHPVLAANLIDVATDGQSTGRM
jgi:hypothetical protein